jgi:ribosomal protein S18 acetylase RimI-like enzyme
VTIEIAPENPESKLTGNLLQRYYEELDARFDGGFTLERTVAAPVAELSPPYGAFLVARIDGAPVGCGAVRMLTETEAEIKRMWVDPGARGRGVGKALLRALEGQAADLGGHTIRLDTSAHLAEAIALYRSSGYRSIPAYNDNEYASYWFEKTLLPGRRYGHTSD